MSGKWYEEVGALDVHQHAQALGLSRGPGRSVGPCPACGNDGRGGDDSRGPIGVRRDGKGWSCFRCEASGDLTDLVAYVVTEKRLRDLDGAGKDRVRAACAAQGWCRAGGQGAHVADPLALIRRKPRSGKAPPRSKSSGKPGSPFQWRPGLAAGAVQALWNDPEASPVLDYLQNGRGFDEDTVRRWGLGAMILRSGGRVVERWLTIPLVDPDRGIPVNVRFRSVPGPCPRCDGEGCDPCKGKGEVQKAYRVCAGRPLPLFGAGSLTETDRPVIVTEGELDVVALDAYGWGVNVVSGTAGAKQDWPDAWLDRLEPFPSFVLAFDDDEAGDEGATKLAAKLGRYRCGRAKLPRNDAGQCLQEGVSSEAVRAALAGAESMVGLGVVTPDHYATAIEDLIANPHKLLGFQSSLTALNDGLGGLAPGVYVITGETGHGKTTFATWLCWDLATQLGEPSLLTSFEQQPIGTVQKLLRMELGGDFTRYTPEQRREGLVELSGKGLQILDKYGDVSDSDVVDAVRYARRRLDCKIALIDHLGFMVRVRRSGEDERQAIERVIRDLATIGVQDDIRILLICHPSNMYKAQQRRVEIGDLKGASAIRQDCHAGFVVERGKTSPQNPMPWARFYFDKVRSEFGQAGSIRRVSYDPLSLHYAMSWEETPSGKAGKRVAVP